MKLRLLAIGLPAALAQCAPTACAPTPAPAPAARTYTVTRVIDGDTIEVAGLPETVRLIGEDTPERGYCGFEEAKQAMVALVLGEQVILTTGARTDTDRYGRYLRYVDVNGVDAGREMIARGLGIARYDSRDGYGAHPRETDYVALDARTADRGCYP